MKILYTCLIGFTLVLTTGCMETLDANLATGAGSDIMKSATISDEEVKESARASAQKMDSINPVAGPDSPYTQRLNKLFAKHKNEDGMSLNYKVYLVKDFNAFAMPDGTVRVFSGLMDQLTDDELLAVIGHEIGHVKLEHSLRSYKQSLLASGVRKGAASAGGNAGALASSQLGAVGEKFLSSQFSQAHELEADKYGMTLMKKHGYNASAMVTSFQKMQEIAGEGGGLMSSHPATSVRIEKMQEQL